MTWRYRIVRTDPGSYALHSVFIGKSGTIEAYQQSAEDFCLNEDNHFLRNDDDARAMMLSLLTKALEDATSTPILSIDDTGSLIKALPA